MRITPPSSTRVRTTRRIGSLLLLAGLAGGAYAGFDFPATGPDACKSFDGEPIGKAGTYPQSTIDKLKMKFNLNDADAKAKLDAIRANINKAKDLAEAEDATVGKCLKDACASGSRMCIDFQGGGSQAAVLPDGTTKCDKDKVNIGLAAAGCAEYECWDPNLVILVLNMLHEGLHMTQDYSAAGLNPEPTTGVGSLDPFIELNPSCKKKVKKAKKASCNEIAAEELENKLIDKLKGPLKNIANCMPPGPLPGGAADVLIAGVQAAPDPKQAAKDMLKKICDEKAGNDNHIKCQKARKAAFDQFLMDGDKKKMNDAIKKTRWFTLFPKLPNFGPITNVVTTGGGDSGKVTQTDSTTTIVIDTGLARATDIVCFDDTTFLIAGVDDVDDGVLLSYVDEDEDGFMDASSRTVLFTSSVLTGGLEMTLDESSTSILIFEAGEDGLYRVQDLDGDGIPESLGSSPVAVASTQRESVHSFSISESGRELYGTFFGDEHAFPTGSEVYVLSDADGDGFFEEEVVLDVFANSLFAGSFIGGAYAGDSSVEVDAPYLAAVEVHAVDSLGNSTELLGVGQANRVGDASLSLNRPLRLGEQVSIWDTTNGTASQAVTIGLVPTMTSETATASSSRNESQRLDFNAGPQHAGSMYLLLGSQSGTGPGFSSGSVHVPLNWDAYTNLTLRSYNKGAFGRTMGHLDSDGRASSTVSFGAAPLSMVGLTLHHSMLVIEDGRLVMASNAVSVQVLP